MGSSLALALHWRGVRVRAIAGRRPGPARVLARRVGARATDVASAAAAAPIVLVAVPDDALPSLARALAAADPRSGAVAVHFSGALPASVLAPAKAAGFRVASAHPVQTFPGGADGARRLLAGVSWVVEGEPRALARALPILARLGGTFRRIPAAKKPLHHLAAVIASNLLVALEAAACEVLARSGSRTPLADLLPLVEGTVRSLRARGLPEALTGPFARGDAATIRLHRGALRALRPALGRLYRALGAEALRSGARMRGADRAALRDAARALGAHRPRGIGRRSGMG